MNKLLEKVKNEPVAIMAAIEAALAVLVVFGLHLSTEQSAALLGLAGAILTIVARQQVRPLARKEGSGE